MKKLICLIALFTAVLSSNAYAGYGTIYISRDHSDLGALASPGQISDSFESAINGGVSLKFQIQGYGSLDGANAYSDVFNLTLNGNTVLSATWDLGGGGANVIYSNPYNAVAKAVSNGSFAGGKVDVFIPVLWLVTGLNTLTFSYSGQAEGLGNEGWGINQVYVASIPEPETYAMLLAGLGLVSFMTRRKAGRLAQLSKLIE
ncbi:FxDxF family PEP-CTERM protein [Janthinobacterium sp.]|uniref:FxDxF family PEP-CTERM protein n=1 Tax=Janthinobacterium sp. TaxID=1871054 RepID=UPI002615C666|nr:FxDxF family PEP-CTERM protein [Janthinobacterium sp.]